MNMRRFNHFKLSIFFVVGALFVSACSTSSDNDTAIIKGSVEQQGSEQQAKLADTEAYVVSAAHVTSNGSFEIIEDTQTETDASGKFKLEIDAEAANNIAVVAQKEGKEFKGFLTSEVKNGKTYTMKTLNTESSAEAEVFSRVVASGHSDIVQKADIEAVVSSKTAAEIESSTTTANRIATGLNNAAEARVEFYRNNIEDDSEEALENTYESLAKAQVRLESKLGATTNAEAREEAYQVFAEAVVDAYAEAELEASSAAKAIEMWSRVFVNSITTASSEVENDARMHASVITAIAIDQAVQAEAKSSDMSDSSKEAIAEAGITLRSDVQASAGVRSDVEAAFENYHEEVSTIMENDSSFEASLIIEINSEINASGGAKSTFRSAISGVLSASLVYDIYESFYSSVSGTVQSKINEDNEAKVESVSEIMILINLVS